MNSTRIAAEVLAARAAGLSADDVLAATAAASERFDREREVAGVRDEIVRALDQVPVPEFLEVVRDTADSFRVLQDVDDGVWWAVTIERCMEEESPDA